MLVILLALFLTITFKSVAVAGQHPLTYDWNSRPVVLKSFSTVVQNDKREISRRTENGGMDCFDALMNSDADNNRKVNKTEYLTFLNLYGPENFLPESVQEFEDLPL